MRSRIFVLCALSFVLGLMAIDYSHARTRNGIVEMVPVNGDGGMAVVSATGTVVVTSRDGGIPEVTGTVVVTGRDGGVPEVTGTVNAKIVNASGTQIGHQTATPLYCEPAVRGTVAASPVFSELAAAGNPVGIPTYPMVVSGVNLAGNAAAAPYVDTLGAMAMRGARECMDMESCQSLTLATGEQGFFPTWLTAGQFYNLHVQSGTVCMRNGQTIGDVGSPCAPGYPYLEAGERVDWPFSSVALVGDGADAGQTGVRLHFYAVSAAVVRICPRVACR